VGGNGDARPAALFFLSFSPILHYSSLNYKARNGSLVLPRSFVAFLMINNRETLAVVAMEFSLKREFRKIQCPLFFSLSLSSSSLLHIHIFIYILYIYILFALGVCHTLNGTSDRRNPPTAGDLGVRGWPRRRRLPFRRFNASSKFV